MRIPRLSWLPLALLASGLLVACEGGGFFSTPLTWEIYEGECGPDPLATVDLEQLGTIQLLVLDNTVAWRPGTVSIDVQTGEVTSPSCGPGTPYKLAVGLQNKPEDSTGGGDGDGDATN